MPTATAGTSSTAGYKQIAPLVARALTQAGVLSISPLNQSGFDAFGSTEPLVIQTLELLQTLGMELVAKTNAHLRREVTFTTAASALSWVMPDDFVAMVPDTAWDRTGSTPLAGSISAQEFATIQATTMGGTVTRIPYRMEGNRLVFPVAPADGLSITAEYITSNWVQTATSVVGPDASTVSANTDYVLFDPTLVVLGLKLKFLEAKGKDTSAAFAAFYDRLEWFQAKSGMSQVLSLSGKPSISGNFNVPESFP